MGFDLSLLQPGDILVFKWQGEGWHTTLFSGKGKILHCVNAQVGSVEDNVTNHTGNADLLYGFRYNKPAVNEQSVALARTWVTKGLTYGDSRGTGVMARYNFDKTHQIAGPPFGYDALYRILKWSQRLDAKFSERRGTTCCAFVMAAFQTAAMMEFFKGRNDLLTKCFTELSTHRSNRGETDRLQLEAKVRGRMEISNVGPDNKYLSGHEEKDIEKIWAKVLRDVGSYNDSETTLTKILTDAMLCDAKFTYSETLYKRLTNSQTWSPVQVKKN